MLKVKNKNTRMTPGVVLGLYCQLWTYFAPCSGMSLVNFEQEDASWVSEAYLGPCKTSMTLFCETKLFVNTFYLFLNTSLHFLSFFNTLELPKLMLMQFPFPQPFFGFLVDPFPWLSLMIISKWKKLFSLRIKYW